MPSEDFYNADKTFKPPDEIRRLLRYAGIPPDQVVHSHCGGGVAASVPWFALGHVPFALNIPADTFRGLLGSRDKLAALLGPAGVNPAHEVVLMAESGLTPGAAMAFLAFEQLGQQKVSVLMDSVDEWGLRGFELTKEPTLVGPPRTPRDRAVPAAKYAAQAGREVLIGDPKATRGEYPKVFVASGKGAAARTPEGKRVRRATPKSSSSPTIRPRRRSTTTCSG